MRRNELVYILAILGAIMFGFIIGQTVYAQENKPLTPGQRIESLTNELLNMKLLFAEEKVLFSKEKQLAAGEMKITVQLQAKVMVFQKQIIKLQEKLKRANANSCP